MICDICQTEHKSIHPCGYCDLMRRVLRMGPPTMPPESIPDVEARRDLARALGIKPPYTLTSLMQEYRRQHTGPTPPGQKPSALNHIARMLGIQVPFTVDSLTCELESLLDQLQELVIVPEGPHSLPELINAVLGTLSIKTQERDFEVANRAGMRARVQAALDLSDDF